MKLPKIFFLALSFVFAAQAPFANGQESSAFGFGRRAPTILNDYTIDLGGNAYIVKGRGGAWIDERLGLVGWKSEKSGISVFFRTTQPQKEIGLVVVARGTGEIAVNASGKTFFVKLNSADEFKKYNVGNVPFLNPGYNRVNLKGKTKGADGTFGEVSQIILAGVKSDVGYVHNFDYYWGRRGVSVHMEYKQPETKQIEYFYNELTVPKGGDTVGSFFMTNGFDYGYCGLQVLSSADRCVIFSVWSSFTVDNPKLIPENQRVALLRQGEEVRVSNFRGEGSGVHAMARFNWKAGETYAVLTRIRPDGEGNTIYTAYLGVPYSAGSDSKRWLLIASFRRPSSSNWYTGAHSFVENFEPTRGCVTHEALFGNQWVCDKSGNWYELTEGRFVCDDTGKAGVRSDYAGGVSEDKKQFFLRTGGFFNGDASQGARFERAPSGKRAPMINFAALERM